MIRKDITGIIFCGGSGLRLGGVEKPLIKIEGKTILDHVIERLHPQVSSIIISCGEKPKAYDKFKQTVISDQVPGDGPLGGFASAFKATTSSWIFTCPGDTPWIPSNLVHLLSEDAEKMGVGVPFDGLRRQNLFLLIQRDRGASLVEYYNAGGRAIHRWLEANQIISTDLSEYADQFFNVNNPRDVELLRNNSC